MTANSTTKRTDSEVTVTKYTRGDPERTDTPGAMVHLGGERPIQYGQDVTVAVAVHDDGHTELTMTAELDDADRLLGKELLHVTLSAQDLPPEVDGDE